MQCRVNPNLIHLALIVTQLSIIAIVSGKDQRFLKDLVSLRKEFSIVWLAFSRQRYGSVAIVNVVFLVLDLLYLFLWPWLLSCTKLTSNA